MKKDKAVQSQDSYAEWVLQPATTGTQELKFPISWATENLQSETREHRRQKLNTGTHNKKPTTFTTSDVR